METITINQKEYYAIKDVVKITNLDRTSIMYYIKHQIFNSVNIKHNLYFEKDEIDKFIEYRKFMRKERKFK